MLQTLTTLLTLGGMAAAAPHIMARDSKTYNLFVGGPGQVMIGEFDGSNFKVTGKYEEAGAAPSWMTYKHSTGALYVNNENGVDLNVFDPKPAVPTVTGSVNGSSGVVFFQFNKDQTRMIGAGYGAGTVDAWDTSATGAPKLLKTVSITGPLGPGQTGHHPHQAILDPSGRFMVIPDLGGDQLLVLDIEKDAFAIKNTVALSPGFGPRHGSFISGGGKLYFVVACELSNIVVLYEADYTDEQGIAFKWISEQSTYGTGKPKNATSAAAGAVLVAGNQMDVYISNRVSGDDTDSIAHFVFSAAGNTTTLTFKESISTAGQNPRSMAFSATKDQEVLFVANQAGKNGLAAFSRDGATGKLSADPIGTLAYEQLIAKGMETTPGAGPQFVSVYLK
ncbi:Lactonase, 7-bladed beta-propeller-domain-containing protein [Nemania sp. FL0031]|nr:Lactonase, 7-bladed beta-propeller-domain-containing protein [Nemania sp. FL0031]